MALKENVRKPNFVGEKHLKVINLAMYFGGLQITMVGRYYTHNTLFISISSKNKTNSVKFK